MGRRRTARRDLHDAVYDRDGWECLCPHGRALLPAPPPLTSRIGDLFPDIAARLKL